MDATSTRETSQSHVNSTDADTPGNISVKCANCSSDAVASSNCTSPTFVVNGGNVTINIYHSPSATTAETVDGDLLQAVAAVGACEGNDSRLEHRQQSHENIEDFEPELDDTGRLPQVVVDNTKGPVQAQTSSDCPRDLEDNNMETQRLSSLSVITESNLKLRLRRCHLCKSDFNDKSNVARPDGSAPCSYHSGTLNRGIGGLEWTCCGERPITVDGRSALNICSPGCVGVYHQDKNEAWDPKTLTKYEPRRF
ncbi:hypothetical protein M406DRAFT_73851 [Cryphonectria parasitica EP155]|uniref:Uncharacterized protein n=1 Tax=Cryphonectria parasitica (strain ATCC 38755 / EP155) TaxID=660469 RepID=A0A9P4XYA6_CRYP1|nr:uncharacterized protein M406DRAFT_73851 [Cryphonectria parasitica EP155]KAF3763228.1 hypothetical protein M406DRAFT_73851 [Cryphonectria parasitica EP155]